MGIEKVRELIREAQRAEWEMNERSVDVLDDALAELDAALEQAQREMKSRVLHYLHNMVLGSDWRDTREDELTGPKLIWCIEERIKQARDEERERCLEELECCKSAEARVGNLAMVDAFDVAIDAIRNQEATDDDD